MINERYLIKKKLGQGRSAVFLCSDSEFPDRDQAIKILSPDAPPEEISSFNNEFFILRRLNHPNIIKSNELGTVVKMNGEEDGISLNSRFLTMEYFDGLELIKYEKLNDEKVLREIIKQLCSVLYYLHQSNYIYYDLKHENILINENSGKLEVKLIDLGFAQYVPDTETNTVRGTAEYMAPELLRNEAHDHRVDLYSLGILLYRIVYNDFPFKVHKEIDIYKSHLEENFEFPSTKYSDSLITVIKKLLAKNPEERYNNTLEVLGDLDIEINEELIKDWIPVSTFSSRKDILTIVDTYFSDNQSSEVFVIKGSEGAGKTALLNEIYSRNNNVVSIRENKSASGPEFIRLILKRIIYSGFIYTTLSPKDVERAEELMHELPGNLIDELKSLLVKITPLCNFILLLDGFNFYDEYILEVFKNIFPILQVNGIKIILSENTEIADKTAIINNLREINLTPFTETQLNEFIERSYYPAFPSEDLRKAILQYADLLPGNIIGFIRDLIVLKLIQFGSDGIQIKSDEKTDFLLKSSHEEIYKLRINTLTDVESKVTNFISSFETTIDSRSISVLMETPLNKTIEILTSLQNKNIIQQLTLNSDPVFTTEGLKRFVYYNISYKKEFHDQIVKKIKEKLPGFNKIELSRQYELAENYYESYVIIRKEISEAEKISAYTYQAKLLNHLLKLPLEAEIIIEIKYQLCKAIFNMGDFQSSLDLSEELLIVLKDEDKNFEILSIKGNCLIVLGKLDEGKECLRKTVKKLQDEEKKQRLLVEIANAELKSNKFGEAANLCTEIINNENSTSVDKGKCYNFLGIIEIYKNNDYDGALLYFKKAEKLYQDSNIPIRLAQIEMNMGNIYSIKGNGEKAKKYWNKSLELNKSIGNLDQEARLLMNFAMYDFNMQAFEKAIESYQRAASIFTSIGNKAEEANALGNIGEIYFLTCEYQKSISALFNSKEIFESIQNFNECLESFFLLCRAYHMIGDYVIYERLLNEFEELSSKNSVNAKHKMNLEFLKILLIKDDIELKENLAKLIEIRNEYEKNEEKYNYFYSDSLLIKMLLQYNKYKEALSELNSKELINICEENKYLEGERLYLLGLLSEVSNELELRPAIEYYLNAYEIIKDLEITELTWKVLFMLTMSYTERGNVARATDYLIYGKSVLDYIGNNFKDERLKMLYFDEPERQTAIQIIKKFMEEGSLSNV